LQDFVCRLVRDAVERLVRTVRITRMDRRDNIFLGVIDDRLGAEGGDEV